MNAHALGILELDRALDVVAGRASSALGAERIRELSPTTDVAWLKDELGFFEVGFSPVTSGDNSFFNLLPDELGLLLGKRCRIGRSVLRVGSIGL